MKTKNNSKLILALQNSKSVKDSVSKMVIEDLKEEILNLIIALEKSVKLQSHYAKLLNMYDGGERIQFKDADEWLKRLEEMESIKK